MSNETLVFHHDARQGLLATDCMIMRPATERTYGAGRGGSRPEFG
ncbi:hypothetical protein [Paraburkholderia sp. HP33-1]|nr:hypothetical protein [Paraburkholderia sp. HP33-1]